MSAITINENIAYNSFYQLDLAQNSIPSVISRLPAQLGSMNPQRGGGRRRRPPPFVEAAKGRLLYLVAGEAGEVASIIKTYRHISKCALDMYIAAYIYIYIYIWARPDL